MELDTEMKSDLRRDDDRALQKRAPKGRSQCVAGWILSIPLLEARQYLRRKGPENQGGQRNPGYRRLLTAQNGGNASGRESEEQRKEREFLARLQRELSKNSAAGRHRALRQLVESSNSSGFKKKALEVYQPGESRSFQKRLHYAQLCLAYGELEKAEKVLKTLRSERPYDFELEMLLLVAQGPVGRVAFLHEISQKQEIAEVIEILAGWAGITEEEEPFFDAYERLVALLENRIDDFRVRDSQRLLQIFRTFENQSRTFEIRSLRPMSSRLPRLKEGEASEDGDWALRSRQREILLAAYGEMLRLRSVREQVFQQIEANRQSLRLSKGSVESFVFELLEKEPVKEVDFAGPSESNPFLRQTSHYGLGERGVIGSLLLREVQDSEDFTEDVLERFVRHEFLSEKEGVLLKALLGGDGEQVGTLLEMRQEELKAELQSRSQKTGQLLASDGVVGFSAAVGVSVGGSSALGALGGADERGVRGSAFELKRGARVSQMGAFEALRTRTCGRGFGGFGGSGSGVFSHRGDAREL